MAPAISAASAGFRVGSQEAVGVYRGADLIWTPSAPIPAIGDEYGGGYVGAFISANGTGVATHMLIVAPKSGGQVGAGQWKTSNTADANPPSRNEVDGSLATQQFNTSTHPVFQWADGLSIGGFTDWYIPAVYELHAIYRNLKPTTQSNAAGFGGVGYTAGANPIGITGQTAPYTASVPAQTSVPLFRSGGAQAFNSAFPTGLYYTSTATSDQQGFFRMRWDTASTSGVQKIAAQGSWRAIRRVAL